MFPENSEVHTTSTEDDTTMASAENVSDEIPRKKSRKQSNPKKITQTEFPVGKAKTKRDRMIQEAKKKKLADLKHKHKATKPLEQVKKPHRWRPGTVARRQIIKLQRGTNNLVPKAPLERCIREEMQKHSINNNKSYRITTEAVDKIQTVFEALMIDMMADAYSVAQAIGKRETLMLRDMRVVCGIRKKDRKAADFYTKCEQIFFNAERKAKVLTN